MIRCGTSADTAASYHLELIRHHVGLKNTYLPNKLQGTCIASRDLDQRETALNRIDSVGHVLHSEGRGVVNLLLGGGSGVGIRVVANLGEPSGMSRRAGSGWTAAG